jgi:hypothetical protein
LWNWSNTTFDADVGANIGPCIRTLRPGGTLVGFGFMGASGGLAQIAMFGNSFISSRLRGLVGRFYGITSLYRKDSCAEWSREYMT